MNTALKALACTFLAFVAFAHAGTSDAPVRRIGYVSGGQGPTFEAFREELRRAGYVEGKDIVVAARFSQGEAERFPALVAELLESRVDVLVAGSPPGAIAAIKADTTIPIVIAGVSDPLGLARSFRRPSSHVTGSNLSTDAMGGKWVELLKEVSTGARRSAVLLNPAHPSAQRWLADLAASAKALEMQLEFHHARNASELEAAMAAIEGSAADALIVTGDPVFVIERSRIAALAQRKRLPAVYFSKLFVDSGGLAAYGGSLEDSYRRAGVYVDRILKGAKPAELPVEPTRIELVLSRKAAGAIGITLPESLVSRADKVID
jgi:putative ABC transport system substrate-binding protein